MEDIVSEVTDRCEAIGRVAWDSFKWVLCDLWALEFGGERSGDGGGRKDPSTRRLDNEVLDHPPLERFAEKDGSAGVSSGWGLRSIHGARVPVSKLWILEEVSTFDEDPPIFHSKSPPTGICCTTTLFPSTSAYRQLRPSHGIWEKLSLDAHLVHFE